MILPEELITLKAGIILDLLAAVKHLHMGAENAARYDRCPTCQLVTRVDTALGIAQQPPPPPTARRLHAVSDTDAE